MFGESKQLTLGCRNFPIYEDVMKHYLWVQLNLKYGNWNQEPTVSQISQIVAGYNYLLRASISTVSDTQIVNMIRDNHDKCKTMKKYIKSRLNNSTFNISFQNFRQLEQKLFCSKPL